MSDTCDTDNRDLPCTRCGQQVMSRRTEATAHVPGLPRLWLGCENAEEIARLDALKAEAEVEEAVYKAEALERGEPFECPRWYVGGTHFPLPREHPLRARDVKALHVFRDDRAQPVYDA